MKRDEREALRRSFQPERVELLFVGEAPPASGRLFYRGDSGLYRAMRDVFAKADPAIEDGNFLQRFRAYGCYLVDLCAEPVDRLPPVLRREACVAAEGSLADEIARLRPARIATLLRSIEENIERAAVGAGWSGSCIRLPYPGRWIQHRRIFEETLAGVVVPLLRSGASHT